MEHRPKRSNRKNENCNTKFFRRNIETHDGFKVSINLSFLMDSDILQIFRITPPEFSVAGESNKKLSVKILFQILSTLQ